MPVAKQMFRALDQLDSPVYFPSEESMREQAPRVARFRRSNLTLQVSNPQATTAAEQFRDVGTQEWDGQPGVHEEMTVEYAFSGTVTARVSRFDYDGVARVFPDALSENLLDALMHELTFQNPEPSDLLQEIDSANVTALSVVTMSDPVAMSDADDEDDDGENEE